MRLLAYGRGSGPDVARLFHRLLAAVFVIAWVSLGEQIRLLIGSRGLLPVAPIVDLLPPTLFRLIPPSDNLLVAGCWLGAGLGVAALAGVAPRVLAALQVILYFSYATACRDFLSFQWDNMLLECGLLAVFLPRDRPARLAHLLFKLLILKLYVESGIAKWQSQLHDWHDGSAMTFYYETAPLPTWLAYTAHRLPVWWHHFESRATLVVELGVPFLLFAPRLFRLSALAILTGFQLVNLATANYGFFVYLALALHVFFLDDWGEPPPPRVSRRWATIGMAVVVAIYASLSLVEGLVTFAGSRGLARAALPLRRLYAPFRLINTYHLFGSITRERIEPEFQTSDDGTRWVSHHLHWKAGPTRRAPPLVAPHQPRVDFILWFYGLGYEEEPPEYVVGLLARMCHKPSAVEELFTEPLPRHPRAVRILFLDYHFASPEAHAQGEWWTATPRGQTVDVPCDKLRE